MTLRELHELARDIRYQGRPCMQILTYDPENMGKLPMGYVWIQCYIYAKAVEDDSPCTIVAGGYWLIEALKRTSVESMVNEVRDQILRLQQHEVNETMTYKGVRCFDPHSLSIKVINQGLHLCPSAELGYAPDLSESTSPDQVEEQTQQMKEAA